MTININSDTDLVFLYDLHKKSWHAVDNTASKSFSRFIDKNCQKYLHSKQSQNDEDLHSFIIDSYDLLSKYDYRFINDHGNGNLEWVAQDEIIKCIELSFEHKSQELQWQQKFKKQEFENLQSQWPDFDLGADNKRQAAEALLRLQKQNPDVNPNLPLAPRTAYQGTSLGRK